MKLKKSEADGSTTEITIEKVLDFRVSTLEKTGRCAPWFAHNSEGSVMSNFGFAYDELNKPRQTDEWNVAAKAYADEKGIDFNHVKGAEEQKRGGLKKADYEAIGRSVIENIVMRLEPTEDDKEDYITKEEWANTEVAELLNSAADYIPSARPIKSKKPKGVKAVVSAEQQRAIDELRSQGVEEDIIKSVYPNA